MKTKTAITRLALAGALMASTAAVRANAFLEIISGTTTSSFAASGANSDSITANGITVGSWHVSFATGTEMAFGDLDATLSTTAGGMVINGLTVIYSSGDPYTLDGTYTFGETLLESTLSASAAVYITNRYNTPLGVYEGTGNMGTLLASSMISQPGGASPLYTGSITMPSYYLTEMLQIGGGATASFMGHNETVNDASTSLYVTSPVPDGGMTAIMIGCALGGLAGLRSKFGRKQS